MYYAGTSGFGTAEKAAVDANLAAIRHIFSLDIDWHEKENTGNKIKKIERGSAGTTFETLIDLCEELNVNMSDLFDIPVLNKMNREESNLIRKIVEIVSKKDAITMKSYLRVLEEMERVYKK
jgi:hypothetical protein